MAIKRHNLLIKITDYFSISCERQNVLKPAGEERMTLDRLTVGQEGSARGQFRL